MKTFEALYEIAQKIPVPTTESQRKVFWCDNESIVGLARVYGGGFEIFLCVAKLVPKLHLVQRHIQYDEWEDLDNEHFFANRIILPPEEYYVSVAAFLIEELYRNGICITAQKAFGVSEPIIEMALRRTAFSDETILGLLGELRFLEILLITADTPFKKSVVMESWRGSEGSSRDFVFGLTSVEVKTTRSSRSLHHINSVMQVDPKRTIEGEPLEQLYILSIGLELTDNDEEKVNAITVPSLVERILILLGSKDGVSGAPIDELFLLKLANYGDGSGRSYKHDTMRNWIPYLTPWRHRFHRVYDMNDPSVQVLRKGDIYPRGFVHLESVNFDIDLPHSVVGDLNPKTDLFQFCQDLLAPSISR